jgi:aminoglycoside phosphotransferase (APT) family kinase protein
LLVKLIAEGRDSQIFALDDTRILRRCREPRCLPREVATMQLALANGYPVPRVHDLTPTDLVIDRIDGPTMAEDLVRRPWRLREHAHVLASLHHRLHDIVAPGWLRTPLGDGPVLVHLDLHPLNVILGAAGPVVIDWTNAARGNGDADAALTWLLLLTGELDAGPLTRVVSAFVRRSFATMFLRRFVRRGVMAQLDAAAAYRLADPNLRDGEVGAIRELLARTRR